MEIKLWYLIVVLVGVGVVLLFAHIGIFVYIYLPACLLLSTILLVKWKRGSLKPLQIGKKAEKESEAETVKVPKHGHIRKVLGVVVLATVIFAFFGPFLWGDIGPIPFVLLIDPTFAPFVYSGLIVGAYLLKSNRKRWLLVLALLITAVLTQPVAVLMVIAMLIEGYVRNVYLFPLIFAVPATTIYAAVEPSIDVPAERTTGETRNDLAGQLDKEK